MATSRRRLNYGLLPSLMAASVKTLLANPSSAVYQAADR
jgi:hypothetical protein